MGYYDENVIVMILFYLRVPPADQISSARVGVVSRRIHTSSLGRIQTFLIISSETFTWICVYVSLVMLGEYWLCSYTR